MTTADHEGWDAFISYSRQNKNFVARLAAALNAYRPPKALAGGARPLQVFLDQHDLGTGDYAQEIDNQLARARLLIVVCTPAARASTYVDDEIARFVRLRGAGAVLPLLLEGLANNEATPAQADEQAFPPALVESMQMPLAVDYRGFDPRRDRVQRGGFEAPWHQLLAKLYGVGRAEIEQREKRRQLMRWRWIGGSAIAAIAVLATALLLTLFARAEAERQRDLAEQRRSAAQARELNVRAEAALADGGRGLQRALLLAVESIASAWTPEAQALLLANVDRLVAPPAAQADDQRGPILALAAVPAQGWLASQGVDRLMIRSLANLKPLRDLGTPRSPSALRQLVASPDGRWLLAGCPEQVACVWDTATWKVAWALQPQAPPTAAAFSPDGQRFAFAFDGGPAQVQLVETGTWQAATPLPIDESLSAPIQGLGFAGDANWLLVRTRSDLELHDLRERRKVQEIDTRGGGTFVLAPDAGSALVDGAGRHLRALRIVRDAVGVPRLSKLGEQLGAALSVDGRAHASIGEDGRRVAVRTDDHMVQLLDPQGGTVPRYADGGSAMALVGADRLVVGHQEGRIELFDLATAAPRRIDGVGADARLALSPDGQQLAVAVPGGATRVIAMPDGRLLASLTGVDGAQPHFSADGHWLMLADSRALALFATADWQPRWQTTGEERLNALWLTPDGHWLLARRGDRIERIALPEGRNSTPIAVAEYLPELRVEPGGARLAGFSPAKFVRGVGLKQPSIRRVWSAASGAALGWRSFEREDLERFKGVSWGLRAVDAQGEWTSAEGGGALALVDAAAAWPLVPDLLATPDPPSLPWLAKLDAAGTPLHKHAVHRATRAHGKPAGRPAWSADGHWLATLGADGAARLWSLAPATLATEACARLRRNLTAAEWRVAVSDEPYQRSCPTLPEGN